MKRLILPAGQTADPPKCRTCGGEGKVKVGAPGHEKMATCPACRGSGKAGQVMTK